MCLSTALLLEHLFWLPVHTTAAHLHPTVTLHEYHSTFTKYGENSALGLIFSQTWADAGHSDEIFPQIMARALPRTRTRTISGSMPNIGQGNLQDHHSAKIPSLGLKVAFIHQPLDREFSRPRRVDSPGIKLKPRSEIIFKIHGSAQESRQNKIRHIVRVLALYLV